tara:strand:- start:587 stop:874 length:288 start_codon:yes stop_codon:yes gene_type:complete
MKITKAKLKEIIKEELEGDYKNDPNQLAPAAALYKQGLQKPLSRLIDKLDQAINTIEGAAGAVEGEVAQTLDLGIKQAEAVWEELHNFLDSTRGL